MLVLKHRVDVNILQMLCDCSFVFKMYLWRFDAILRFKITQNLALQYRKCGQKLPPAEKITTVKLVVSPRQFNHGTQPIAIAVYKIDLWWWLVYLKAYIQSITLKLEKEE